MTDKINLTLQNLRQLLESRAERYADKTFLFAADGGRSRTYAEFDRIVNRTANLLAARGAKKGAAVSLLLPNGAEYVIAYFACWKIGAIANPVNSLLKADEIAFVVGNCEAETMLVDSQFLPTIAEIKNACPTLRTIIEFDDADKAAADFPDAPDEFWQNQIVESDDEAIIIYTSGTTGKPKGCLLTHGNLLANARQIAEWMTFGETDRLLTVMPLFHMNAVSVTTLTALYAGGSTVVAPKFSASKFWQIIRDYEITSFGSVATMLSMLLAVNSQQLSVISRAENPKSETLRFAMCGSAPVPVGILREFEETFGCLVIEGYGLSESTCRSTFNPPDERRRPGSCGQPIGNEMRIFDDDDREVADGELGEIVLRGANVLKGYFKNPEATAKAFRGGWFHTGDVGYQDADGFFYVVDRKSEMIIRGGENIYPREIDEVLYAHPAVAAAAAIGIPDELYGEAVAAFVVVRDGGSVSEKELIDFCRARLADFKCPQQILFAADIPKGATGKLLKRELQRLYAATAAANNLVAE